MSDDRQEQKQKAGTLGATCLNCRWRGRFDLRCHYFPKIPVQPGHAEQSYVKDDDWCAHFEQRPRPQAQVQAKPKAQLQSTPAVEAA